MIAVDASVWVSALGDASSPAIAPLRRLLDIDQVVLLSPVRLGVLARLGHERQVLARALCGIPLVEPGVRSWRIVERLAMSAADAGVPFDLADLLIAALADEHGARVWSFDPAFVRLAELGLVRLYDGLADESWRPGR